MHSPPTRFSKEPEKKVALIATCNRAVDIPAIPGTAAPSTRDAVELAHAAKANGVL